MRYHPKEVFEAVWARHLTTLRDDEPRTRGNWKGAPYSDDGDSHGPHHDAMQDGGEIVIVFDLAKKGQHDGHWYAPRWDALPGDAHTSTPSAGRTMYLNFRTNSVWKHAWKYATAPAEGTCRTSLQFTLFVGTGYTEAQIAELAQFVCECPVPARPESECEE